jgi:uncharacterized protein (DUF2336 family)
VAHSPLAVIRQDELGVGLSLAASSESLLDLARSREPADRERLLLGIVDLCASGDADAAMKSETIQGLLGALFMSLVVEAEREIRQRLADKLSCAEWAPSALINVLALDEIEIARPIIAHSPVLQDPDLLRLLVEATIEHKIEVARRPRLGAPVVDAILEQGDPAVIGALAGNHTAEVTPEHMQRLVDAARLMAPIRSPLARHPKLTSALAEQLYTLVSQALRQGLSERFRLDTAALDKLIAESTKEAHASSGDIRVVALSTDGQRQEMERRLIDKLHAAGQLRPGYLIRALREQRLSLFVTALAQLGRFEPDHVQRAINSDRPELLALACSSVGIDRSVFPTILLLVRQLNGGRPAGGMDGARRAAGAFGTATPEVVAAALKQAAEAG